MKFKAQKSLPPKQKQNAKDNIFGIKKDVKFKAQKSSGPRIKQNVKGIKFAMSNEASSPPVVFAKFVKREDFPTEMSGRFFKKSKSMSTSLNNSEVVPTKQSTVELGYEMDTMKDGKIHKRLKKLKFFPEIKEQTKSLQKHQVLGNDGIEFNLTATHKNSDGWKSLSDNVTVPKGAGKIIRLGLQNETRNKSNHGTASVKQTKAMKKQEFKSRNCNASKEQISESSPFLKQKKSNKEVSSGSPQTEVNISGGLISGNKKKSKKKKPRSALENMKETEVLIDSSQESDVPDVGEKIEWHQKLKKRSKETGATKLNTCEGVLGEGEEENIFLNFNVNLTALHTSAKQEDIVTCVVSKRKKRKGSFSGGSDLQFCEADESFRAVSYSKNSVADVLVPQNKRLKKNTESPAALLNQETVVRGTKKDVKQKKKKFLQKSGILEGNNNVSKTETKTAKSESSLSKTVIAVTSPDADREIEYQREKKKNKKKKRSLSENSNLGSGARESCTVPSNENKNFKLDYGNIESKKIKKEGKKNKKFENTFDDVMQDSVTAKNVSTGKRQNPAKMIKTTPVLSDEDISEDQGKQAENKSSKTDSSDFIKLHQKKLRGFDGREDTPERLSRTVFVGNLPLSADKEVLQMLFKSFGNIECVRMRCAVPAKATITKRVAQIKKKFHKASDSLSAFVVFSRSEDAEKALALNKTVVEGHHIRVDLANKGSVYDDKRTVFVGNLSFKISNETLWTMFGECGSIEAVRIIRDPDTGAGKGFGFVLFEEEDSVKRALLLNETEVYGGRTIRVHPADKNKSKEKASGGERRQSPLKMEKRNFRKSGAWRLAGQKKTKKKLIKKKKDMQMKKRIASILTHK